MANGEWSLFLQLLESIGTVAVLVWLVFQFKSGKIIPEATANKLISAYKEQAEKAFAEIVTQLKEIGKHLHNVDCARCPLANPSGTNPASEE